MILYIYDYYNTHLIHINTIFSHNIIWCYDYIVFICYITIIYPPNSLREDGVGVDSMQVQPDFGQHVQPFGREIFGESMGNPWGCLPWKNPSIKNGMAHRFRLGPWQKTMANCES